MKEIDNELKGSVVTNEMRNYLLGNKLTYGIVYQPRTEEPEDSTFKENKHKTDFLCLTFNRQNRI